MNGHGSASVATRFAYQGATPVDYGDLEPELVMPEPPRAVETPERRLLVAVLEAAYDDARKASGRKMRGVAGVRLEELYAWSRNDDVSWPYSLASICDFLGLDFHEMGAKLRDILDGAATIRASKRIVEPGAAKPLGHTRRRRARIHALAA